MGAMRFMRLSLEASRPRGAPTEVVYQRSRYWFNRFS